MASQAHAFYIGVHAACLLHNDISNLVSFRIRNIDLKMRFLRRNQRRRRGRRSMRPEPHEAKETAS